MRGGKIVGEIVKLAANIEFNNTMAEVSGTIGDDQTRAVRRPGFDSNSPTRVSPS